MGNFYQKYGSCLTKSRILLPLTVSVSVLQVSLMGFKRRFYRSLGGSLSVLALAAAPALAEELQDWSFDTDNSELTFSLSDQVFPEFFLLSDPPRLVLDIPDTEIGNVDPEQIYDGTVRAIRVAQHTPENVRVVIELAPAIVLSPEQADIQFDDGGDGQRYWRFRPLIADRGDVATAQPEPTRGAETDVSLSAASLRPSEQQATALPLDPYETDSSSTVVSVPPLEDLPQNDAVAAADVPELPPMTVPALEDTTGNTLISTDADAAEPRQDDLPNLDISAINQKPGVPVVVEPSERSQSTEAAVSEDAADAVSMDTETTAADTVVEDVNPVAEPAAAIAIAGPEDEIANTRAGSTETALAPVELSSPLPDNSQAVNDSSIPQTIQQPAAERTIVQTELPAPVPFGQPLPGGL